MLWRVGAFLALVAVAVVVAITVPLPSIEQIRSGVGAAGAWAGPAFVLGYGLLTLTPVPKNVVSIAAGLIWGLPVGFLLVYTGAMLGASLAFALGRSLGREAVERFTGARVEQVDSLLRSRGLLSVIGARLIPVLPFTVVNYSAGLTAVSRWDYGLGTLIGMLPGTVVYVAVGAYGLELGWGFAVAAGALGILIVGGVIAAFVVKRRRERAADGGAADA